MKQACEQATANNGAGGVDGFKGLENYISNNLSAAHRKVLVTSLLAKKTGLSKPRFARHFYKTFGCSARVYIQSKRMSSALHFLTTSDMAIGEIADAIGYADFSSFTRAFKKYHGLIPFAVKRSGNPKP